MGLVEHPAADLALGDGLAERAVAQLLGRDVEQRHVAHPDSAQHVAPLRRGEQAVQRRGEGRARAPDQPVHLVLHQGLQRRDDDGQDAAAVIAHQGRQLEAQRLAAAVGRIASSDSLRMPASTMSLLQAAALCVRGVGRKSS